MSNIKLYSENLAEGDQLIVEKIAAEAEKTPPKDSGLAIHVGAIVKLRAKGYSYRDIAAWFTERGIKANHVDVWRAHKNSLAIEERVELAEHDDDWREFVTKKQAGGKTTFTEKAFGSKPAVENRKSVEHPTKPAKPSRKVRQRKTHKGELR
jgi:hypothetical protein